MIDPKKPNNKTKTTKPKTTKPKQRNQNNKTKHKPFLGVRSVFNPFTNELGGNFLPSFCISRRLLLGVTTASITKEKKERGRERERERERGERREVMKIFLLFCFFVFLKMNGLQNVKKKGWIIWDFHIFCVFWVFFAQLIEKKSHFV